jgi:hypothetical protein
VEGQNSVASVTVQQQHQEMQKQVAALSAEAEQKRQMVNNYSATIDRITGAAA